MFRRGTSTGIGGPPPYDYLVVNFQVFFCTPAFDLFWSSGLPARSRTFVVMRAP
jgi:hypothetical protein